MATNNNQPKFSIFLTVGAVTGSTVTVTAEVIKNNFPVDNMPVQFYQDGLAIGGANGTTNQDGKLDYTFTFPKGAVAARFTAKIPVNGGLSNDILVGIPVTPSGVNHSEVPKLIVEDTKHVPGVHRISTGLFAKNGRMVKGLMQIVSNKPFTVMYPFSGDKASADRNLLRQMRTLSTAHEVPVRDDRWCIVDISYEDQMEIDVLVAGCSVKMQLDLPSPKPPKPAVIPMTRPIWAAFCIFLFLISLFVVSVGTSLGIFMSSVMALIVASLIGLAMVTSAGIYNTRLLKHSKNKAGQKQQTVPYPGIMSMPVVTNNRWWVCMLLLTFLAFILFFTAPAGTPVWLVDNRDNVTEEQRKSEYVPGDQAQKIRNTQRNLGPVTDRQLVKERPQTSWEAKYITGIIFLLLFLLTFVYTFFAFSDEAIAGYHAAREKVSGKITEGTVGGEGFFAKLLGLVKKDPAATPETVVVTPEDGAKPASSENKGSAVSSVFSALATSVVINLVIEILAEVGQRAFSSMFSKKDDRRYREA